MGKKRRRKQNRVDVVEITGKDSDGLGQTLQDIRSREVVVSKEKPTNKKESVCRPPSENKRKRHSDPREMDNGSASGKETEVGLFFSIQLCSKFS